MTIELKRLVKTFGSKTVVDHIDVAVKDGGFTVLLGPSGCGKTTTLRMIAGLEAPTSGQIILNGRNVTMLSPKERGVAMVFQDYGLYPHMTVYENVAFPLKISRVSQPEIQSRVKDILTRLNIEPLGDRRPAKISGGEKQRVSLARALVRRPSVLLMDEPLSNLDALLRVRMRAEIKTLHQEMGTTTLYVTHDQVEALSLGTEVIVMRYGRIEQQGTPHEIYYQPATRFVARFVGSPSMNFLPVALQRENGTLMLIAEGIRLPLSGELSAALDQVPPGTKVQIGIRPEHFTIAPDAEASDLFGTIRLVEPLGKDQYLHVSIGSEMIIVRADPEEEYHVGDDIRLTPSFKHLYFFEEETGKRIHIQHEVVPGELPLMAESATNPT